MLRTLCVSAGVVTFFSVIGSANAQQVLSSCDPVTGLSVNGTPCVSLTPVDPASTIIPAPEDAEGADTYQRLDPAVLGQTYECRRADTQTGVGPRGAILIEDCGAPLSSAELGQLQPFYGTVAPPAPPPAPVVVAPAPPPPVVVAAPAPPVVAPVTPIPAAGLSGGAIAAGVIGAAALAGIIIAVADDDDDDGSASDSDNDATTGSD